MEIKKYDDLFDSFWETSKFGKQEHPKIVVPRLIDRLKAIYDKKGEFYLDNDDVNVFLRYSHNITNYLLALLNSKLIVFIFQK